MPMRRAVYAVLGTAAAASWLVAFKVPTEAARQQAAAEAPVDPAAVGAPPATGGEGGGGAAGRSAKGTTEDTPYGSVTVSVTVTDGKVTAVSAVVPDSEQSQGAAPKLREQALAKQSADLDTVSGATYTSDAYRKSLQAALDKAK